jgi:hypothetical protein
MASAKFESMLDFAKRDVDVAIRCNHCRHTRMLTIEQACDIFGMATRVARAQSRCRCSECGGRGARMTPIPKLNARDLQDREPPKWLQAMRRSAEATARAMNQKPGAAPEDQAGSGA